MQEKVYQLRFGSFSRLITASFLSFIILFILAASRHLLLQSNAYDLGIFEQYLWMASRGIFAPGTIHGIHIFADHGAFILLPMSLLYLVWSSPLCLLAMQSFCIAFTAIPLWKYTKKFDASDDQSWLVAVTWWMTPLVFNANLFDFHPEICLLPLIVYTFCQIRDYEHPLIIAGLLLCILLARDGNVLLLIGIAITLFIYRKLKLSFALVLCSYLWILFLSKFLYPFLGRFAVQGAERYSYLGGSLSEFFNNLNSDPINMFAPMQPLDSFIYILMILAPFALLLRKSDPAIMLSTIPLLASNVLSSSYSQKTLIHHYSLPIVLILLIATITKDNLKGFYGKEKRHFHLFVIAIVWISLAKPTYFTSIYQSRAEMIEPFSNVKHLIKNSDRLITSSYLAPHFSGREYIKFPQKSDDTSKLLAIYDTILLNPTKPGWGSSKEIQIELMDEALVNDWNCAKVEKIFDYCKKY